jgi:hypothetical protein
MFVELENFISGNGLLSNQFKLPVEKSISLPWMTKSQNKNKSFYQNYKEENDRRRREGLIV